MTFVFTAPKVTTAPAIGAIRFDYTTNLMHTWDGTQWVIITNGPTASMKKLICEDLSFGSSQFYKVAAEGYDFDELNEWTNETFGPPRIGPGQPECKWFISGGEFYFHEAKHRDWFVLKWSSGDNV